MADIDNINNAIGPDLPDQSQDDSISRRAAIPENRPFLSVLQRYLLLSWFQSLSVVILLPFCAAYFAVFLVPVEAIVTWVKPVSIISCIAVPALPAFWMGWQIVKASPVPVSLAMLLPLLWDPQTTVLATLAMGLVFPLYLAAFACGSGRLPVNDADFLSHIAAAAATWLLTVALYVIAGICTGNRNHGAILSNKRNKVRR